MEAFIAVLILIGVLSFGGTAEKKVESENSPDSRCPAKPSATIEQGRLRCGDRPHFRDLTIPRVSEPAGAATVPTECPDD
jgi:hypothetical protein